jgi:hypothetical protein
LTHPLAYCMWITEFAKQDVNESEFWIAIILKVEHRSIMRTNDHKIWVVLHPVAYFRNPYCEIDQMIYQKLNNMWIFTVSQVCDLLKFLEKNQNFLPET